VSKSLPLLGNREQRGVCVKKLAAFREQGTGNSREEGKIEQTIS
jgi:hypothetical protein